jgi:hypothetical protein
VINAKKVSDTVDDKQLYSVLHDYNSKNQSEVLPIVYSHIGKIIQNNGDDLLSVTKEDGKGFVLYGPYKIVPEGHYKVLFKFLFEEGYLISSPSRVCVIDVAANGGSSILAKKEIRACDVNDLGYNELKFTIDSPATLEFRVFSLGELPFKVGITATIDKI